MEWEKILSDSVEDGKIRELHLSKIPTLKSCENWDKVVPIGLVNHRTKHAYYKGALIRYNTKIYYISDQKIDSLSQWINWKFPTTLKVVKKEEAKE